MIYLLLFLLLTGACLIRSLYSTDAALGFLICLFGVKNYLQAKEPYFVDNSSHVNIAIGCVALVAAIFWILRSRDWIRLFRSTTMLASLGLYAYAWISYLWTPAPDQFLENWPPSIPYMAVYLIFGAILSTDSRAVSNGLKWALGIGTPVLILSLLQCEWGERGMLLASHRYANGVLITETMPLAVASFATSMAILCLTVPMGIPAGFFLRVVIFLCAFYTIFKTQSRGQAIVLILLSIPAVLANSANSLSRRVINGLAVLLLLLIGLLIVTSFADLTRWQEESLGTGVDYRANSVSDLLNYFAASGPVAWLIGIGCSGSYIPISDYCHCLPVEIAVEFGLVGVFLYVVIYWNAIRNTIVLAGRQAIAPEKQAVLLTWSCLFAASTALSFKSGSLFGWHELFLFAICLESTAINAVYDDTQPDQLTPDDSIRDSSSINIQLPINESKLTKTQQGLLEDNTHLQVNTDIQ